MGVRAVSRGDVGAVRLRYRPPLAWDDLLSYLSLRATPGVEEVVDGRYRRTASLGGRLGVVELECDPQQPELLLHLRGGGISSATVVEKARRLADLDAEPHRIESVLGADERLGPLVARRPGLRVPGAWDAFELAVRAVLGQQVTVRGASILAGRLAAAFGERLGARDGTLTRCFPTPSALSEADVAAIGLPQARARTIRALAVAVRDDRLVLDPAADLEQTRAGLEALPGIGPWTAQYVALRALRDADAFPASDLGLRRALGTNGGIVSTAEALACAEAWRPFRGYAALHLWLAGPEQLRAAG